MRLACLQTWSTTLFEEMEHYVFCGRLSSHHSGFTIPWTMAVYTQCCLIFHSVEVCVYVCVCVCLWVCMCVCVCLLRAGSLLTLTESQPHPPPHCPPPPKAPIFSAHLRKSWCSHNSGLNECCSRRVLLLLLLTELHVLTILSADEWSGAGGRRWRQEGVG